MIIDFVNILTFPILSIISIIIVGNFFSHKLFATSEKKIEDNSLFLLGIIIGFAFLSQITIYAVLFNFYTFNLTYLLWTFAFLISVYFIRKEKYKYIYISKKLKENIVLLYVIIIFLIFSLFLFFSYNTPDFISGDAKQYHLAFPYLISLAGGLDFIHHSFENSNRYLGYDILYLFSSNLKNLNHHPIHSVSAFLVFNMISNILLPIVMYIFTLDLTKNKKLALLSSMSLFTTSIAIHWLGGKNDIFAGASGLTAIYFFYKYLKHKSSFLVFSIVASFSITVKLTNLIPLLILLFTSFLLKKIKIKDVLIFICVLFFFLLPWSFYNFIIDNTFFPIDFNTPLEIKNAISLRSANGYVVNTFLDYIVFFPKLFLQIPKIPGSESIGYIYFIFMIFSSSFFIFKFKYLIKSPYNFIFFNIFLWTIIFYVWKIEGRFLTRYIFLNSAFYSISFFTCISYFKFYKKNESFSKIVIFITLLIASIPNFEKFTNSNFQAQKYRNDKILNYYSNINFVNNLLSRNEIIATRDSLILFFKPPIVNLSAIQSEKYNLHSKDLDYVKNIIEKNNIKYLHVLNSKTSGHSEALNNYLNIYTTKYRIFKKFTLYRVK